MLVNDEIQDFELKVSFQPRFLFREINAGKLQLESDCYFKRNNLVKSFSYQFFIQNFSHYLYCRIVWPMQSMQFQWLARPVLVCTLYQRISLK